MIDYHFGEYLIKNYYKENINFKNSKNTKLAIVMVATKESFWLPLVIKNTLSKIKNCNFYFFGTHTTINLIKSNLKDADISYNEIDDFSNIKFYNNLLLDYKFWNKFREDYVLITQPDCIILRNVIDSDFNYDYIGAICGTIDVNKFIINGGLSIRRNKIMKEICKQLENKKINKDLPEDIIFTNIIREKYNSPSLEACYNFSIESIGNIDKVLGIHGTDKYYIHPKIKLDFINKFF
tara:strand:- start:43 stop:753 length:711 start_codon:yes stop_codon:yes gene_type:complete